jgi:hypothetical protein
MQNIIETIIKRKIKHVILMQRLGEYYTLSEVIDMIFKELAEQRVIITQEHREYIKDEVQKRLQYKLKQEN